MAQFKATISWAGVGTAGYDSLLVLSQNDNLEEVSQNIHEWAQHEYHENVITSAEKLNNSNQVYVSDIPAEMYDKIIML